MGVEDVSVQIGVNNFGCRNPWYREDNAWSSQRAFGQTDTRYAWQEYY